MTLERSLWRGFLFCALMCALPGPGFAQNQTSAITGVVKDQAGAVLSDVRIEVSSPALIEGTRAAVTDRHGAFRIIDLRPGVYAVTFARRGFITVRWQGLELAAAASAVVSRVLAPGLSELAVPVSAGP